MAKRPRPNTTEDRMARSLDKLASYEEFAEGVLPRLRQLISQGLSAEQIEKDPQIQALLVARQLSIAFTDPDSARALSAIKDARDRTSGKAVERKEVKHQMADAPDEQLDARLKTLLGESSNDDDTLPN